MLIKRNFGLDLLRALAISLVLIAHFIKAFETVGFWGVELFFALSGFLIGKIIWNNFNNNQYFTTSILLNFWKRRWWRTLPNYLLFLVVMIVFQYLRSPQSLNLNTIIKSIFFFQNFTSREVAFFSVSWSLCIEEWFYITFPLLLFLFAKLNLNKQITFLACIVIFVMVSIVFRFYFIQNGVGHSLRGITLARLDAIVFGVFTANFFQLFNIKSKSNNYLLWIGILILAFCIVKIHFSDIGYDEIRSQQLYLILAPLSFALVIPAIEKYNFKITHLNWFNKSIEKISLWSYSIYLSHIPVLFTIYAITSSIRTNTYGNIISKLIGIICTLAISALVFKYFENPLTNKRPKEINAK